MIRPSACAALLFFACALPAWAAPAPGGSGIAATVNDDVITRADVDSRVNLYLSGTKGTPPPEALRQMRAQVLDRLIDEKLQLREAKTLGIAVSDEELAEAFAQIAKQNNFSPEEFKRRLAGEGVKMSSMNDQLRAEISWSGVIRRKLRPQISISEGEIDHALAQVTRASEKPQYRVAEIFLPVKAQAEADAVRIQLEKIAAQIRQGGRFSDAARAYSQAPGAAQGGDLGWLQDGQLGPEIEAALKTLKTGELSAPIRSEKGYHLIFLREVRQPEGAKGEAKPAPGRDEVANRIGMQRLDQMQDRYLRDLRATAFIDKRP